jgi:hypothetical protein
VNASWRQFDPAGYFENVREVLDVVDRHTEPGSLRDGMYAQWYRGKMLGRLGGPSFLRREPEYRRELYEEIRRLALERYSPPIDDELELNLRVRARLLRGGRYAALEALAQFESQLAAHVKIRRVESRGDGSISIELEASLKGRREPFAVARNGPRFHWLPPQTLRDQLQHESLDMSPELRRARVQVVLRSVANGTEYLVPSASEIVLLRLPGTHDAKYPVVIARADIDRAKAAAGARLPRGEWEVMVVVGAAGFRATAQTVKPPREGRLGLRRGRTLTLVAPRGNGRLLTRPRLRRRVARRFPYAARLVKSLGAHGVSDAAAPSSG